MTLTNLRFTLCAAALFGLCTYSAIAGPAQLDSITDVLEDPVASAGKEIKLASDVRVAKVRSHEVEVQQHGRRISVRASENKKHDWEVWREGLQVGDYVSLRATFHSEGYLLLHDMHVHKGRRLKIWVSLFAFLVLAGILIHERTTVHLSDA